MSPAKPKGILSMAGYSTDDTAVFLAGLVEDTHPGLSGIRVTFLVVALAAVVASSWAFGKASGQGGNTEDQKLFGGLTALLLAVYGLLAWWALSEPGVQLASLVGLLILLVVAAGIGVMTTMNAAASAQKLSVTAGFALLALTTLLVAYISWPA